MEKTIYNINTNTFMTKFIWQIEREIHVLRQSLKKPLVWKTYIDDVLSLCNTSKEEKEKFLEKVNTFHPTIKFMAEISETEIAFLDTKVYKDDKFHKESILQLYIQTHYKITYGDLSKAIFKEKFFELRLDDRGYPANVVKKHLSEVKFLDRKSALKQKNKAHVRKYYSLLCNTTRQ